MKSNTAKSGESAAAENKGVEGQMAVVKAVESKQQTPPTVEQRIAKLEEFQKIRERRDRVKDAADNLNFFRLEWGGESLSVAVTTSEGKKFSTANAVVANSVLDLMQSVISRELEKVDNQILELAI